MSGIEIEAKTVEEAIAKACEQLNLTADQLNIEIVSQGSPGIFGLGTKKAKILVAPKEVEDEVFLTRAKEILEQILSHIQVPATVSASWVDGQIKLDISSNGSGLLIGKRGKTLQSLQYIVNKMFNKRSSRKVHILIDTENYRERRRQALTEVALQLGERVKKSGKPAASSPMSAYDRRILHLALKDDHELRTRSKGEGEFRKVVVFPVKKQESNRENPANNSTS
ncbi:MAG: protein jag [Deltaproteobacteria bacterium]|nr:protein jag [Deltaproteobacteria bacterium]MBW2070869.1 protein jag [Deltaproteobacteria bacterium]